ncbi:putative homeodomain-interacting protein kinase 3, partial [Apostichopus japonicus]
KLPLIRKVAVKLLQLLGFLQKQNVIHADLKPENILCPEGDINQGIKVIDFGNAIHCVYDELALYYDDYELQTIVYRAPEVICGLPFGTEIDLWSVGCILAELYIGRPLFFARTKGHILGKIYQLLGPLPVQIYQRGKFFHSFDHLGGPAQPFVGSRMSVQEAIQHPFLAPEIAIGFFLSSDQAINRCYSQGISLQPSQYNYSPYVSKMLKSKNSMQLLRNGTGSECNTDKMKRAVAEVPPLVRASVKGKEVTDSHVTTGELTSWKSEVSSDLGKEKGEEKRSCPENRQGKSGASQPQISVAGLTDEERLELPLIEGLREGSYDYDDGIKYIGLEDENVTLGREEDQERDEDQGREEDHWRVEGQGRGGEQGKDEGQGRDEDQATEEHQEREEDQGTEGDQGREGDQGGKGPGREGDQGGTRPVKGRGPGEGLESGKGRGPGEGRDTKHEKVKVQPCDKSKRQRKRVNNERYWEVDGPVIGEDGVPNTGKVTAPSTRKSKSSVASEFVGSENVAVRSPDNKTVVKTTRKEGGRQKKIIKDLGQKQTIGLNESQEGFESCYDIEELDDENRARIPNQTHLEETIDASRGGGGGGGLASGKRGKELSEERTMKRSSRLTDLHDDEQDCSPHASPTCGGRKSERINRIKGKKKIRKRESKSLATRSKNQPRKNTARTRETCNDDHNESDSSIPSDIDLSGKKRLAWEVYDQMEATELNDSLSDGERQVRSFVRKSDSIDDESEWTSDQSIISHSSKHFREKTHSKKEQGEKLELWPSVQEETKDGSLDRSGSNVKKSKKRPVTKSTNAQKGDNLIKKKHLAKRKPMQKTNATETVGGRKQSEKINRIQKEGPEMDSLGLSRGKVSRRDILKTSCATDSLESDSSGPTFGVIAEGYSGSDDEWKEVKSPKSKRRKSDKNVGKGQMSSSGRKPKSLMESSDIQASDSLWEAADDANPMSSQELSDMSSDRDDEEDVSKPPSCSPLPPKKIHPTPNI